MKFIIRGCFTSPVDTKNINQFPQIKISENIELEFFDTSKPQRGIGFKFKIDASSREEAEKLSRDNLNKATSWFAVCFDVPVDSFSIEEIGAVGEREKTHFKTLACSVYIVRPLTLERVNLFNEGLPQFIKSPKSKDIFNMFQLYNEALKNPNETVKFWNFYNILQILFGERKQIDDTIQTKYKDKPVKVKTL